MKRKKSPPPAVVIEPLCPDFGVCGGCAYQNTTHECEREMKEKTVLGYLTDAGITDYTYLGMVSGDPVGYRNKMEFSFGDNGKGGELSLGIRRRGSFYEVVPPANCNIVDHDFRAVALAVQHFFRQTDENFYHRRTHHGALRYLVVRKARFTGEILVNLVTTSELATDLAPLTDALLGLSLDGGIVGVLHTINNATADAVKCDELRVLYGREFFFEQLLGLRFKISAFSFFQTNSAGAERLYAAVRKFAGDLRDKTVLDLYCGTGTIAQVLSATARRVVGVELVEEAVEAAKANAQLNALENCTFLAGDVLALLDELTESPDLVVLDPPREGVHPKALPKILGLCAREIIYVSCKPSSLARDLPVFVANGYQVRELQIHEMFPRTEHVECVVRLSSEKPEPEGR